MTNIAGDLTNIAGDLTNIADELTNIKGVEASFVKETTEFVKINAG